MEGKFVYHYCEGDKSVNDVHLDVFYDLMEEKWYLKIEEPEFDVFECPRVVVNYCPICGAKLTSNDEKVLLAKEKYLETELERIRRKLKRLNPPVVKYNEPIDLEGANFEVVDGGHPQKAVEGKRPL